MLIANALTVNTPRLDIEASPDNTTPVATLPALPTKILADVNVEVNFELNVVKSLEAKYPFTEAVAREIPLEGNEWVGVVGRSQWRDPLDELQCVMWIGVGRTRASPDQWRRNVDVRAAHRARPSRCTTCKHCQPAATRALNSVIISSQTGRKRRSPRQKSCDRRASKKSNGVPCCSTHV